MSDWLAILISFIYVFAALGLAELLRKVGHYGPDFTRKFVHIAVGMWAIGTIILFESRWYALIPPASFVLLNYLSYRWAIFKAIEIKAEVGNNNLGTVYFPIAFCLILLTLWDYPGLVVAALMPLTWGDAMAAILGKAYGHLHYTIWGQTRTIEGSVSMFIFSGLSVFLALILLIPTSTAWYSLGIAALTALCATIIEAISPWGLDNLTIPLISSLVLYFFIT